MKFTTVALTLAQALLLGDAKVVEMGLTVGSKLGDEEMTVLPSSNGNYRKVSRFALPDDELEELAENHNIDDMMQIFENGETSMVEESSL